MGGNCCRQYTDKPYELTNLSQMKGCTLVQKKSSSSQQNIKQENENFKEEASATYINDPPPHQERQNQEIKEMSGDIDIAESIEQSQQMLQDCIPREESDESDCGHCDDTNTKKTILKHELRYVQNDQNVQQQNSKKKKVRFDLKSSFK